MTTQTVAIEDLLRWSDAELVQTRNGPRMLRTANPTQQFWATWKASREALKSAGVSVSKHPATGDWNVCWWLPVQEDHDAVEASHAKDSDLVVPCADGVEFLPYQRAGIAYCLDRPTTLLGDDMGVGKSAQSIGVVNATPAARNVLVICPASLRLNWRNEIVKFASEKAQIHIIDGGKPEAWSIGEQPAEGVRWVVCNYDVVAKHRDAIDKVKWDVLITDECQALKNGNCKRSRAVLGHVDNRGSVKQKPIKAKRVLFLTGTPIMNRPKELWPMIQAADPKGLGKNFMHFAKRYCDAFRDRYGWNFNGASNLEELQTYLRRTFMIRRLKADVLPELPSKRRQVIELPANGAASLIAQELEIYESHRAYLEDAEPRLQRMTANAADAYLVYADWLEEQGQDAMAQTWRAGAERPYVDAVPVNYHPPRGCPTTGRGDDPIDTLRRQIANAKKVLFEEMAATRKKVAMAKVPKVTEYLTNALEQGPVVCFAHHRDVVDALAEELGDRCVTLTGATPMAQRQAAVDRFQNGEVDLFIGNIQAAGTGHTLVRSSHVVFAELDWVPANLTQAEDRCARIGQKNAVTVVHLVLERSLDSLMAEKLIAKQEVITAALDAPVKQQVSKPQAPQKVAVAVPEPVEQPDAEQVQKVLMGLRMLANRCDGARALDGMGFNGADTEIGHSLARQNSLSPKQFALGMKLLTKYRRQLPQDLVKS